MIIEVSLITIDLNSCILFEVCIPRSPVLWTRPTDSLINMKKKSQGLNIQSCLTPVKMEINLSL